MLPIYRLDSVDSKKVIELVELPAFEHYWSDSKGSFYGSAELRALRGHCQMILLAVRRLEEGTATKDDAVESIECSVIEGLAGRKLKMVIRKSTP